MQGFPFLLTLIRSHNSRSRTSGIAANCWPSRRRTPAGHTLYDRPEALGVRIENDFKRSPAAQDRKKGRYLRDNRYRSSFCTDCIAGSWLLFRYSFEFSNGDRGVAVPLTGCRAGTCLDRFCRAMVDAPAAELAAVFPDRSAVDQFDVFSRADRCTDPA